MNRFIGVGRLPRNAVVVGKEKKVLRFTLATPNSQARKGTYWSYVPCIVFKPSEELASFLTQNGKGAILTLEGRVNTSRFESKGQTRYSTEVIVDERSIHTSDDYAGAGPGSESPIDPELERLMVTPPENSEPAASGQSDK